MKATTMRARKKGGKAKIRSIEYRRPDKGPGMISTTHHVQPEGLGSFLPSEETNHPDDSSALDHFQKSFGITPPAAPADGSGGAPASPAVPPKVADTDNDGE
jgi:hypothetical protein